MKNLSDILSSPWVKLLLITAITGFLSQLVDELRLIDTPISRILFSTLVNIVLLLKKSPFDAPPEK